MSSRYRDPAGRAQDVGAQFAPSDDWSGEGPEAGRQHPGLVNALLARKPYGEIGACGDSDADLHPIEDVVAIRARSPLQEDDRPVRGCAPLKPAVARL